MTQREHELIVEMALAEGRSGDLSNRKLAAMIVERVLGELGQMDQKQRTAVPAAGRAELPAASISTAIHAVDIQGEYKESIAGANVIRPIRPAPIASDNKPVSTVGKLHSTLSAATPKTMTIVVGEEGKPVLLERTIEPIPALDCVKVNYGLPGLNPQTPSAGPNRDGGVLPGMAIDQQVSSVFSCYDENSIAEIDEKLAAMRKAAVVMFGPAKKHIVSSVTSRSGHMSYHADDPHDDTPAMINPLTGREY